MTTPTQRAEASEEVYKLSLGALPAGATVLVEVSFAQTLRAEASSPGALRLVLPSALLHRYVPTAAAAAPQRLGGSGADVAEAVAATAAAIAARGGDSGGADHPSLRLRLGVASAVPLQVRRWLRGT